MAETKKRPQNKRKYTGADRPHFTTAQVKSFLHAAEDFKNADGSSTVRLLAMFLLGFSKAMRVSEIANLKVGDISLEHGTVAIRRLKGSNAGHRQLTELNGWNEKQVLAAWLKERAAKFGTELDGPLFPSREAKADGSRFLDRSQIYRLFEDVCRLADQKARKEGNVAGRIPATHHHVHVLKHSIITELIRAGVPLQHVQVFTGHKNINSLLRYMTPSAAEVDKEVGEAFVKMF